MDQPQEEHINDTEGLKSENKDKKKKDKPMKPDRGIETMFRVTANSHIRLSEMADYKSNILLTINSIIVSVLVSVIFRKMEEEPTLLVPSLLLLFTSLITVVLAILVTRPKITHGVLTKEDIRNKKGSLLFFGNYHRMTPEDYEWGITYMMKDTEFLYGSMIRDNYNLGLVLEKKYRMLRVAYTFFMIGFVSSVVAFILYEFVI